MLEAVTLSSSCAQCVPVIHIADQQSHDICILPPWMHTKPSFPPNARTYIVCLYVKLTPFSALLLHNYCPLLACLPIRISISPSGWLQRIPYVSHQWTNIPLLLSLSLHYLLSYSSVRGILQSCTFLISIFIENMY